MFILKLDDPQSGLHELVGGKGANLGQLTQAGFPVPAAFTVTTAAYAQFFSDPGVRADIAGILAGLDYDDIEALEARTARIRELVVEVAMPDAVRTEIVAAYSDLGSEPYVAVRSSGTAEDLAGTSFAGMHDTYLDIRTADEVIDATKRCWASLWTARATGYRHRHGFDHFQVSLAVVVQIMVESEASGVMFTGNPRTAATDETVINATWGLGEALVQGSVTPDEYLVKSGLLRVNGEVVRGSRHILERTLGSKESQIIRDRETGHGVVTTEVEPERRGRFSLSDDRVLELARIGARITEYYDGYPQDIEWALAGSTLYVVQSRPITGVEFSWDADLNTNHRITTDSYPAEDPYAVRTRVFSDEVWTGAISPLMYSWRGNQWNVSSWDAARTIGRSDLLQRIPMYYHKGCGYWDCEFDKGMFCENALPATRGGSLARHPESAQDEAASASFNLLDYAKQMLRISMREDERPYNWFKVLRNWIDNGREEARGLPDSELMDMTDRELEQYIDHQIMFEDRYNKTVWLGFFMHCRDAMTALQAIVDRWYDGDNANAFTHLVTGTPKRTISLQEHVDLAEMAREIRASPALLEDFTNLRGAEFFDKVENAHADTRFSAQLADFLKLAGHRGHADRDIYFPRYGDDPPTLYAALNAHLKSDDDFVAQEERNTELREAAYDEVLRNLRRKPLGFLKAEAFKIVHDYVMTFLTIRDDERSCIDLNTMSIRRGFIEVNRRLMERGLMETDRDFWFLGAHELYDVLYGRANLKLTRWKIEGRMRNFDRIDQKLVTMPKFLRRNQPVQTIEQVAATDAEGRRILRGSGTSSGEVTATARVIKSLKDIGRVNKGEILVANSTDPGWTPVFAVISGVIVETGGLLSHSGCLAREYGFPAAAIETVVSAIPDGATITLNGDGGWVRIDDENLESVTSEPAIDNSEPVRELAAVDG